MTTNSMEERAREHLALALAKRGATDAARGVLNGSTELTVMAFIEAAIAFAAQPDGMVLVPREPTPEMIEAGAMCEAAFGRDSEGVYYKPEFTWSAMVSAAVDGGGA